MSWGLGWKRPSEVFNLTLQFGDDSPPYDGVNGGGSGGERNVTMDWTAGDDEDQVALRLQSKFMVAVPAPEDAVVVELTTVSKFDYNVNEDHNVGGDDENGEEEKKGMVVKVGMKVVKRRDPLRVITMSKAAGSGQQSEGIGVLTRLLRSKVGGSNGEEHWDTVTVLNLCGCAISVLPVEVTQLPLLQKLYLNSNKLSALPPEVGQLRNLKVLRVDENMLASVPVELRQCVGLVELSLEHNKLIRPLLDFRAMSELRVLRLFGNPLEFLPEILPLQKLRHLSLANIRIVADENLRSVNVQIETETTSYFGASKHKLSAFFSLIFRFSSCHHPLLASALAKIMEDPDHRVFIGKDENAIRQLISMISSDDCHVVHNVLGSSGFTLVLYSLLGLR